MPTFQENCAVWDHEYDWSRRGEEWSAAWGTAEMQWLVTLLPRIRRFVPARRVLEIGPGYGRWTHYLRNLCDSLVLVDLSPNCIEACRERFASDPHIEYHVNDGSSLDMIEDGSIDFIFSFDSLVHAEHEVMAEYVREMAQKLSPEGVGFVHHSNLAAYRRYYRALSLLPRGKGVLARLGLADAIHATWRAPSMSAAKFRADAESAGLRCLHQELHNWHTRRLIDCISVFVRKDASWEGTGEVFANPRFMEEARHASQLAHVYVDQPDGANGRRAIGDAALLRADEAVKIRMR